jgi:hypothetical protein
MTTCVALRMLWLATPSLKYLDITDNEITALGLDHVTRFLQGTRLQRIKLALNQVAFRNEAATTALPVPYHDMSL